MISATPQSFPGWWTPMCTSTIPGARIGRDFDTATRAAAAGGYTFLVDMPLNCLPATTTVAHSKRSVRQPRAGAGWIGQPGAELFTTIRATLKTLAAAGVPGFKCFLIHPGIDGFTMVSEQQLRAALPRRRANRFAAAGARGASRTDRRGH